MMIKQLSTAAALALLALPSFAQEAAAPVAPAATGKGYYLGLDTGRTHDDTRSNGTSIGIFGGYQFHRFFSVEAGYRRLLEREHNFTFRDFDGNLAQGSSRTRMEQRSLSVLGAFPVAEKLDLLGRVGYNEVITRFEPRHSNTRKKGLLLGAGVSYKLAPNVDARLEWQRASGDTRNVSAGIAYRF